MELIEVKLRDDTGRCRGLRLNLGEGDLDFQTASRRVAGYRIIVLPTEVLPTEVKNNNGTEWSRLYVDYVTLPVNSSFSCDV